MNDKHTALALGDDNDSLMTVRRVGDVIEITIADVDKQRVAYFWLTEGGASLLAQWLARETEP